MVRCLIALLVVLSLVSSASAQKVQYLVACYKPGTYQAVREVNRYEFFTVSVWARTTPGRPNTAAAYCDVHWDQSLAEFNLAHTTTMFAIRPPYDEFARHFFVNERCVVGGGATSLQVASPALEVYRLMVQAVKPGTVTFQASLEHCSSPRFDTWLWNENGRVDPKDIWLGSASVVIK